MHGKILAVETACRLRQTWGPDWIGRESHIASECARNLTGLHHCWPPRGEALFFRDELPKCQLILSDQL